MGGEKKREGKGKGGKKGQTHLLIFVCLFEKGGEGGKWKKGE